MNVYKIGPDHKKFKAFIFPMTSLLQASNDQIPLKKLMDFYKFNLPLSGIWSATEAIFNPVEGVSEETATPDITTWVTGTLVLSGKAKNALTCLEGLGEYLPVQTPEGRFWIFNCFKICPADENKSRRITENDQIFTVEKLEFKERAHEICLFKTDYDGFSGTFCTETLKNDINSNNLRGLIFSQDLTNLFYL